MAGPWHALILKSKGQMLTLTARRGSACLDAWLLLGWCWTVVDLSVCVCCCVRRSVWRLWETSWRRSCRTRHSCLQYYRRVFHNNFLTVTDCTWSALPSVKDSCPQYYRRVFHNNFPTVTDCTWSALHSVKPCSCDTCIICVCLS